MSKSQCTRLQLKEKKRLFNFVYNLYNVNRNCGLSIDYAAIYFYSHLNKYVTFYSIGYIFRGFPCTFNFHYVPVSFYMDSHFFIIRCAFRVAAVPTASGSCNALYSCDETFSICYVCNIMLRVSLVYMLQYHQRVFFSENLFYVFYKF